MYKVVIVEDEAVILKGLVYSINWEGMDCVVAGEADNGADGLQTILEKRPDIVVTDIRMPQMDGLEMLGEASRQYEFFSIVLTGYSEFEYVQQAMRLNTMDYLLKPIDEAKLVLAIQKAKRGVERMRSAFLWERCGEWLDGHDVHSGALPDLSGNYYVNKAIEAVQTRYADKVSLRGMADELGVSESHLARKFKEATGLTFLDYLNRFRLQKAIQLMREGGLRIGEISDRIGFTQYKQFSVTFRKYLGMSPTTFLRAAKREESKKPQE